MKETNVRYSDQWDDIGFSPLPPGWINIYKDSDGTYWEWPCPGVLIQESTIQCRSWVEEYDDGRKEFRHRKTSQEERMTRVVFASNEDEVAELTSAESTNYVTTTTIEDWNQRKSEFVKPQEQKA